MTKISLETIFTRNLWFRAKASLKRHITRKNVIIRAPESVSIYKISSSRFGCPPLGRIYYDTEISREAN